MSSLLLLLVMFLNVVAGVVFVHGEDHEYFPVFPLIFWAVEALVVVIWLVELLIIGVVNYGT